MIASAWAASNPGLGTIKSHSYMVDSATRALAAPGSAMAFRVLDMNIPGSPEQTPLVSVSDWLACETSELPPRAGWVVAGFDAGGSASMTAAVALWESGRMESWGAFPDNPDLLSRGQGDGVGSLYQQMADRGELRTFPGRVTPAGQFLESVAEDIGQQPLMMACDGYRRAEIADLLSTSGLNWMVDWRRMGTGPHGSEDVRAFQRMVLNRSVSSRESLLVRAALRDSLIRYDPNGNEALDKRRSRGRIDVLSAAILASGLWERQTAQPAGLDPSLFELV